MVIGNRIRGISGKAFANCENLSDVFCYADNVPSANNTTFDNSFIGYATLHVPSESLNKYKTTSIWKDFGTIAALTNKETGINVMENENLASSDYYLLNGLYVNQPQKGLVIVKKGKQIKKVLLNTIMGK